MPHGAYGLEIAGISGAARWLQDVGEPFERVEVVRESWDGIDAGRIDDRGARFPMLGDVVVETSRESDRVLVRSEHAVSDDDLLHPLTGPALAVRHLWAGRQILHSGVVGTPDGAVVVLGGREFGKSSTLADIAVSTSLDVFSDDLCVTDGTVAWTGPRCIDLRAPTVEALGHRWQSTLVRSATRSRMTLGPAPASVRLLGTVLLGWSPTATARRVPPAEALPTVVACKMHAEIASDAVALLAVGALPMLAIERPRDLSTLSWTSKHVEAWVHELLG